MSQVAQRTDRDQGFDHEAFFYADQDEFVDGVRGFLHDGAAVGDVMLVVVDAPKIDLLRRSLREAARPSVMFADMGEVGRNPARIIPAWRDFVDEARSVGRRPRGVGEPIGPARRGVELAECYRHEALLNVAFGDGEGWRLLCPYDTVALPPEVLAAARRTHPVVADATGCEPSREYQEVDRDRPFADPLPDPPVGRVDIGFGPDDLEGLRTLVAHEGELAGVGQERLADLVLAVNELATNSLRHGGGAGRLRVWREPGTLVCEVWDRGFIDAPLIGRELPPFERLGGRGLWLVNQLCDVVRLHSTPAGTAIRVLMRH